MPPVIKVQPNESDRNLSYTINNLVTYEKSFGDHSLSVLLGQEAYALEYKLLSAEKAGISFSWCYGDRFGSL
ncbi:MAG: hypothetical protein ACLR6J_02865 [Parabacteroides merdae]